MSKKQKKSTKKSEYQPLPVSSLLEQVADNGMRPGSALLQLKLQELDEKIHQLDLQIDEMREMITQMDWRIAELD